MKSAGVNLQQISEKQYITLETENSIKIIKGLEQSDMPFFAKYDDVKIILTYSKNDENKVNQILTKAVSGDEEEILMFKSEPDSLIYARLLLPEIADLLGVSVDYLENRPQDIQILLAQTYVSYRYSDNDTIKKALERDIFANHETENKF